MALPPWCQKHRQRKIAQGSGGWLHGQAGRSCVYKENGKRALHGVIGGPRKYGHRAERKFCVLLTAPRGGKAKKNLRCARNNGRVARKHPPKAQKHHQKRTKNTHKNRAYARKISPDAKTKKPIPMAPPGPSNRRNFRSAIVRKKTRQKSHGTRIVIFFFAGHGGYVITPRRLRGRAACLG